jgi:DNA-binding LytR/AlgR family response regulator
VTPPEAAADRSVLRAVIADDEAGARMHLRSLLEGCRVRTVAECDTGRSALAAAARERPDLVCLDVRMPDLDGLEAARPLAEGPAVIFTTGFPEHAAAAFEIGATDYLLKPLSPHRVAEAVRRVRLRLERSGGAEGGRAVSRDPPAEVPIVPRILVPADDHRLALRPDAVRYVEARDGDVIIHTDRGDFRLHVPIVRLECLLAPWGFLRTHRAFLVNLARVSALVPWSRHVHSLLLDGVQETHVPVAKSRLAALRGSVIWISPSGGLRSGPGTAGKSRDRGRVEPRAGPRDRRGAGG